MAHPTLRQLQVFERLARCGNFSQVARELHLTQPTVSMQMAQLQDIIGSPLYYTHRKKLHLTEAGEIVLAGARMMLDGLEQMQARLQALKGLEGGRLRLGVVTSAKFFAPRLLGHFLQRHPAIEPTLSVTQRDVLLERMRQNLDDLYIFSVPPEGADLCVEPFMPNELVAIAARQHPLARRRRPIPLAELCAEPFLMREPGSGTRITIERHLARHGITIRPRMELGSNYAIEQAVATGLGVSIVSRTVLAALHFGEEIRELTVEGLPIRGHWYLVCLGAKAELPVVGQFRRFIQQHAGAWPVPQRRTRARSGRGDAA
ncbi:MAG: LysR family transcriptional regulator [Thiobacillaceae bacterium]|nr:LysR family transcriptional regulator [Thiobacillaceae bacterium]